MWRVNAGLVFIFMFFLNVEIQVKLVKVFDEPKFRVPNLNFITLLPAEVSGMAFFYPSPLSLFWKVSLEGPQQM